MLSEQLFHKYRRKYTSSLARIIGMIDSKSISSVLDISHDNGGIIQAFFEKHMCDVYQRVLFSSERHFDKVIEDNPRLKFIESQELEEQWPRFQLPLCAFRTHLFSDWQEEIDRYYSHLETPGEMVICDWAEDEFSTELTDYFAEGVLANYLTRQDLTEIQRRFRFLRHENVHAHLKTHKHYQCTLSARMESITSFEELWSRLYYVHAFWRAKLGSHYVATIKRDFQPYVLHLLATKGSIPINESLYILQVWKD